MRPTCALLSAFFVSFTLVAQLNIDDSLRSELSRAKDDTTRVHLLYSLAEHFANSKPDSAFTFAIEGLTLSRKIGDKRAVVSGLATTGSLLGFFGNHPEALNSKLQGLRIAEQENDPPLTLYALMNVGNAYFELRDYPQALEYFQKANELAIKLKDQGSLNWTSENLGATYIMLQDYDSALMYTQQAYSIANQLKQPLYNMRLNLGHIYSAKGQHGLALEYFRSALPEIVEADNQYSMTEAFSAIAKEYEKDHMQDSVLYYGMKAYKTAQQHAFLQRQGEAAAYLGGIYRNARKWDSAYHFSEEAKAINDSLFNQQKRIQLQTMTFAERLRQKERDEAAMEAATQRSHNIQYAGIAVGAIGLLILFLLLSHSIIVNQGAIRFLAILTLLIVFEFINLVIHPFVADATHHSPVLMLLSMVIIAALLIPIHHKLEHWITEKMVEKNKRIRLAAARKTIAELEGTL